MKDRESVSVVVPVYNEADNLPLLHDAVTRHLDDIGLRYELIFVNDGSCDNSLNVLRRLSAHNPRVKIISLSRNFGHQSAISAGMDYAGGAAVIVMDADMQHPPDLIPEMIARWREGYQVVYTVREDGQELGPLKRWTSAAFYKCINLVSEVPIVAGAADFRLMDRAVVDCLVSMPERSRFLRGMISWVGFRQIGLPYVAQPRHAGQSKYSIRKMISLAAKGLTSFSSLPLRFSAYLGVLTALAGVPYAAWAVYTRLFTDTSVPGWASLMVAILFLGGVQLMFIGIMGEYVGRVYNEVKGRPLYIAEELIGFEEADTCSFPGQNHLARGPSRVYKRAS